VPINATYRTPGCIGPKDVDDAHGMNSLTDMGYDLALGRPRHG
jgi:hypothetical protein